MNCVNVFDNFERLALKGLSSGKMTHIISLSSSKMTHTIGAGEKHYRNTLVLLLSEMSFLQAGAQRCSVKGVFIEFSHNWQENTCASTYANTFSYRTPPVAAFSFFC